MEEVAKNTRQRANTSAGKLVQKALGLGRDMDWIAAVCGVERSSVARWKKTGIGEAVKVRKLEAAIGPIETSVDDVANIFVGVYLEKRAFHFTDSELFRIGGLAIDDPGFIADLTKNLYVRGYFLLKARTKGVATYHLLSHAKVRDISSQRIEFTSNYRIMVDPRDVAPQGTTDTVEIA